MNSARRGTRKGESIAGLMLKSVLSSLVEKTGTNRAGEFGLMADFLAGNKTGLKNKLMGMMVPMLLMVWRIP